MGGRERPPGRLSAPPSLRAHNFQERSQQVNMDDERSERARHASAVGTAITRLHREHYGRGASVARTVYQGDYLIAFLEDIYTPLEKTLLKDGRQQDVKQTRQLFQMAMQPDFTAEVEKI